MLSNNNGSMAYTMDFPYPVRNTTNTSFPDAKASSCNINNKTHIHTKMTHAQTGQTHANGTQSHKTANTHIEANGTHTHTHTQMAHT